MKKSFISVIQKYHIEISIILCFVLPPLGILSLLLMGFYHLHFVWNKQKRIDLSPGLILIGSMFIATIGSAVFMNNYSYFLISALLLAYFGLYLKIKNDGVQKWFSSLKWISIAGGLYFYALYPLQDFFLKHKMMGYLTGTSLLGDYTGTHYARLIGAGYNPNFTVTLLLFGLAFLLADGLKSLREAAYQRFAGQAITVCLFMHAIFLTGSRAGFAIMLVLFLLVIFRWNQVYAVLFTLFMCLDLKFFFALMPRSEMVSHSADVRKEIWKNSIHLWQNHSVFGMTPIGFHKEYVLYYHEYVPHAHNIVLGMFTEYGALGGVAFLMVVAINIFKMLNLYFSKPKNKIHLNAFLLALPVILLTGMFDYVIYSPQVAIMTIILVACWDKYTANIPLLSPRVVYYLKKGAWILFPVKAFKDKSR